MRISSIVPIFLNILAKIDSYADIRLYNKLVLQAKSQKLEIEQKYGVGTICDSSIIQYMSYSDYKEHQRLVLCIFINQRRIVYKKQL